VSRSSTTRRRFLATTIGATTLGAGAAGLTAPYVFTAQAEEADKPKSKNDRFRIAAVGLRYQGSVITEKARAHGDVVAIADVDRNVREQARASFGSTPNIYEDYRKMFDKEKIDVVLITTPDHWHTKIAVDAARAGLDIYCEKPLTLTIDEGKILCRVVKETGRVLQTGSWQRSDARFRLAVELVRLGHLGKLHTVTASESSNPTGGPFAVRPVPGCLNWDLWQGQTPSVPYVEERCHYTFRWWYEYSGGKMTDWGAHDLDIGQWALGAQHGGPVEIDGHASSLPADPLSYNVAPKFHAELRYANGVRLLIGQGGRNGLLLEGDKDRIFVNRGTLAGKPVDALAASLGVSPQELPFHPGLREKFYGAYADDNASRTLKAGKLDAIVNHMGNFSDCVKTRRTPISDVVSQHRSASTCHLANIAIRLGRKLHWDPETQLFVGDAEANAWLRRPQRKGYQIEA
jgi:predicted dehydrogenase